MPPEGAKARFQEPKMEEREKEKKKGKGRNDKMKTEKGLSSSVTSQEDAFPSSGLDRLTWKGRRKEGRMVGGKCPLRPSRLPPLSVLIKTLLVPSTWILGEFIMQRLLDHLILSLSL